MDAVEVGRIVAQLSLERDQAVRERNALRARLWRAAFVLETAASAKEHIGSTMGHVSRRSVRGLVGYLRELLPTGFDPDDKEPL